MPKSNNQKNTTASSKKQSKSTAKSSMDSESSMEDSMSQKSMLQEFFEEELKDIYWAEKHLTKAIPKMAKATTTDELKDALEEHLSVTEEHVSRLEEVFGMLGKKPQAKKCEAMEGLTKEGDSIIEDTEDETMTRDVGIIMAAQKVEHYEIATYGGLVQLAKTLGLDDVADMLGQTLEEEKEADEKLTAIAEEHINLEASEEPGSEEE